MTDEIKNMPFIRYMALERRYLNSIGRTDEACAGVECSDCLLSKDGKCTGTAVFEPTDDMAKVLGNFEIAAERLLEWEKEHPQNTRQSMLLEQFPNVRVCDGYIDICPQMIDMPFKCAFFDERCDVCKKKYWHTVLEEVK